MSMSCKEAEEMIHSLIAKSGNSSHAAFPTVGFQDADMIMFSHRLMQPDCEHLIENGEGHFKSFLDTMFIYRETTSLVLLCLYAPVFLVAFFGNLLVLAVVLPNRYMRNVTNCLIVNLAVADLLVTVICVPLAVGRNVYKLWVFGETMCKLTCYMQGVTVAASVFTIATLSFDRYIAIKHPMTFKKHSAGKNAWRAVVVVWTVSLVAVAPLLFVATVKTQEELIGLAMSYCTELWSSDQSRLAYDFFLVVLLFLTPGFFVTVSYSLVGYHLWKKSRSDFADQRRSSVVVRRQIARVIAVRRRVAKMLLALAVLFGICWLPYYLLLLYMDFLEEVKFDSELMKLLQFAVWLGHSNSAFNPLLYCFMNKCFRKCTARLLRLRRQKKHTNRELMMHPPLLLDAAGRGEGIHKPALFKRNADLYM